ncbi:hypothetical protein D3H35_10035 [Cohnella faecalis]|uniref:Uncharacterized protein n=1 Tax=Cohnella faecalis TaxID=2315694 RepID=A0A398CMW1_9BACL|nr:hypothetical protein D3H35_10035 [Cohnella faecalis]
MLARQRACIPFVRSVSRHLRPLPMGRLFVVSVLLAESAGNRFVGAPGASPYSKCEYGVKRPQGERSFAK